jgi:putative aldouronate transport system permease protein
MSLVIKPSKGEKIFDVFNVCFMCFLGFLFLYPVLNVLAVSLSDSIPVLQHEVSFYPKQITFAAYRDIIGNKFIFKAYGNTIFVAVVGCISSLLTICLAAYPIAFCDFYGKKLFSGMILIALWFGGGIIPTYLVMNSLHLTNTLWALIINVLCSSYYVIVLRSFFVSGIPKSLIESMRIDGANDFRILFGLVIPLSKAALATIALWIVVGHWNDFFAPLMYLQDRNKYTLQIILRDIILQASGSLYEANNVSRLQEEGMVIPAQIQNSVIVVSMLPMLIIYPFLQKYFVKGVTIGAVKG